MFHHFFVCGIEDIAQSIIESGQYSLEFERKGHYLHMYVRFWKEEFLCKVYVCRSGLLVKDIEGELGSLSRFMSAVSSEPDIVACSGVPLSFIETIDKSPMFKRSLQYPYRFDGFNLEKLMHKRSYSVFGRIDFFSVMRQLLVSLGGSLDEAWAVSSPELSKVIIPVRFASTRCHISYSQNVLLLSGHSDWRSRCANSPHFVYRATYKLEAYHRVFDSKLSTSRMSGC